MPKIDWGAVVIMFLPFILVYLFTSKEPKHDYYDMKLYHCEGDKLVRNQQADKGK